MCCYRKYKQKVSSYIICKECNEAYKPRHSVSYFCSKACEIENRRGATEKKIKKGAVRGRPTLKRYLLRKNGHCCEMCNGTEWMGEPIPLELDHINGDAGNNMPDNLRLLCPNCHTITPYSNGKNRGNGRKSRGVPLN